MKTSKPFRKETLHLKINNSEKMTSQNIQTHVSSYCQTEEKLIKFSDCTSIFPRIKKKLQGSSNLLVQ